MRKRNLFLVLALTTLFLIASNFSFTTNTANAQEFGCNTFCANAANACMSNCNGDPVCMDQCRADYDCCLLFCQGRGDECP